MTFRVLYYYFDFLRWKDKDISIKRGLIIFAFTLKENIFIASVESRLGTGHKVQGGWAGKICFSGDGFLLTLP